MEEAINYNCRCFDVIRIPGEGVVQVVNTHREGIQYLRISGVFGQDIELVPASYELLASLGATIHRKYEPDRVPAFSLY